MKPARKGRGTETALLLFTAVLLSAGAARAQTSADRASVGFTFKRGTRIGLQGEKLDGHLQLDVRPMLPSFSLGQTRLVPLLGFSTEWMGMQRRGRLLNSAAGELGGKLQTFQLGLTLVRPVTPRWLVLVGASGTASTDFSKSFNLATDTSWSAFVMANYFIGGDPRTTLTLGLASQYPFTLTPVFPLVGFAYHKDPYVLELGFPRAALLMKVGSGLEWGVTGALDLQVFRVHAPEGSPLPASVFARETSLRFGPTLNVRMGRGDLWLSSSVGVDFMNDYALLDEDRKRIASDFSASTKPAPYLRMMLSWRPPHHAASDRRPAGASAPDTGVMRGGSQPE
ncbi:hypothetical protein D7Y27_38690 [Corallococcus sp. AB004]|uniref:hypothetical protein n=1 Tax=Corallococcus exiguus TaxID=83462 RepID=UPI000EA32F56|nr:hypothetical protein [Corallococcus exiguus]NPC73089.1 hypothetical protein [Corallococcus exiguus]NPD23145.1 hypothetical protein [Corallococcus exiguus]RKI30772.1 hypothetical protein D7Y27_38690 [Corallococcus sp. AB004]